MYCLVTFVEIPQFTTIGDQIYSLGVGNKVAFWSEPKYVPIRRYKIIYPEVEFYIYDKYYLSDISYPNIRFRKMANGEI